MLTISSLTVCIVQFPITPCGYPAHYLHKHLCPLHHARDHGPQPAWVRNGSCVNAMDVPIADSYLDSLGYSGNVRESGNV